MSSENRNPDAGRGAEDSGAPADTMEPSGAAGEIPGAAPGKVLSPEAIRALQEAQARREAAPKVELPAEIDGRGGEEPTRYGDWEKKGLAVDF
jgi:hypothetical protein